MVHDKDFMHKFHPLSHDPYGATSSRVVGPFDSAIWRSGSSPPSN